MPVKFANIHSIERWKSTSAVPLQLDPVHYNVQFTVHTDDATQLSS